MASKFEKYRMLDGRTPLAAEYFNPIFQDLDSRLGELEVLQVRVDSVIAELQNYGLSRIDTSIAPIIQEVNEDLVVKVQQINDYLEQLDNATIAGNFTVQGVLTANKAGNQIAGLVKVVDGGIDPVVYPKTHIDDVVSSLANRITAVEVALDNLSSSLANLNTRLTTAESLIASMRSLFVSGKNFGGGAVSADGNSWQASTGTGRVNVTASNGSISAGIESSTAFFPTLSEAYQAIFSTNFFTAVSSADMLIEFPSLSAGSYQARLWIFQPTSATPKQSFDVYCQGELHSAFNIGALQGGRNWTKIKIDRLLNVAGNLILRLSPKVGAPAVRIAGAELFREDS